MKRFLFTMMTLVALVLVANTTFAQNEQSVVEGGTYGYTLTTVKVNTAAGSSVTITVPSGSSVSSITHGGTPIAASGDELPSNSSGTLAFNVTYGASSGNIVVTVADGGAGACSNSIQLAIVVAGAPTVDVSIGNVAASCQGKGAAGDNTDAAGDVLTDNNTWTFTVTIDMTNVPADFDGTATLALGGAGATNLTSIAMDALSSTPTGVTFTAGTGVLTWDNTTPLTANSFSVAVEVGFTTTEGLDDQALTLTASSVSVTENGGNQTYNESATGNNQGSSTVYNMPLIGSFN